MHVWSASQTQAFMLSLQSRADQRCHQCLQLACRHGKQCRLMLNSATDVVIRTQFYPVEVPDVHKVLHLLNAQTVVLCPQGTCAAFKSMMELLQALDGASQRGKRKGQEE